MPKADATVIKNSSIAGGIRKSMEQNDNMMGVDFRSDANLRRKIEFHVYIYNISPRQFTVRRPPLMPCLHMKACPSGERFVLVAMLPDIVQERWPDPDSGEIRNRGTDGERVAMDIINPVNTTVNLDMELPEELTWIDAGGGDDLSKRGLFFTRNNPPREEEVSKAYARMEKFYRSLISRAKQLAREGKVAAITEEMHLAADYFHIRESWHETVQVPALCDNCGEPVKPTVAYHVNSAGVICVRNWRGAIESGVKKRDEVPKGHRWWLGEGVQGEDEEGEEDEDGKETQEASQPATE